MGLCSSIDCACAINSDTLTITGDGSPGDPWVIGMNFGVFAYDTYDDLPDPSSIPDLSTLLVREASELVLVRDGLYALSGTVFTELLGTPSETEISGDVDVDFSIDTFTPNLPFTISGGDLVMHEYFHPAEIAIRGIGYVERSDEVLFDWVEVDAQDVAGASGPGPFRFLSDAEIWINSDTSSEIVPVFGVVKPESEELGAAPLVVSTGGASFEFRARSLEGTINDQISIWASFTWNTFSYQGQA